ncbi:MAG TPA: zinc ribbon domain-containing protein [Gaiellaceae bacterium]|nr:zinc ribbon domain-containing protein [Gaiellaceae bacterium]
MPIYEYRCPDGHTFEIFQRMSDPSPDGCEVCGKAPLEKLLYPVAVHFKGSGFYATDYGKGAGKKGTAEGGSGGESSSTTSTDSGSSSGGSSGSGESKAAAAD